MLDSAELATRALDEALQDPRVHKHVDVTADGLRRFFEALDTNVDGVLSADELEEGFQRTLNDFGLWEETEAFARYWRETWALLLEDLAALQSGVSESVPKYSCARISVPLYD